MTNYLAGALISLLFAIFGIVIVLLELGFYAASVLVFVVICYFFAAAGGLVPPIDVIPLIPLV